VLSTVDEGPLVKFSLEIHISSASLANVCERSETIDESAFSFLLPSSLPFFFLETVLSRTVRDMPRLSADEVSSRLDDERLSAGVAEANRSRNQVRAYR